MKRSRRHCPASVRPRLENLEDRLAPATISIRDATATEGPDAARFVDFPINSASFPLNAKSMIQGPHGDYLVANFDANNNSVLRYDETTFQYMGAFVSSGSGGLNNPIDLVFANGDLLVSSRNTNSVLRYNGQTGNFSGEFVPSLNGNFEPTDLVVRDGMLYVGRAVSNDVLRFDLATGAFVDTFVAPGAGGLNFPTGMAFGPDGNFYVANYGGVNKSILRYNGTTGALMDVFVPPGSGGLVTPLGIEFGPDGNLYVGDAGANHVLRYDGVSGAFLDEFAFVPSIGIGGGRLLFTNNQLLLSRGSEVVRFEFSAWEAFNVTLSSVVATPVTVQYATGPGTAIAGSDFINVSGTLTFAPGETTKTIIVRTIDNGLIEPTEDFVLNLSNPLGADIADGQGVGAILDNDPRFFVVNDATSNQTYKYDGSGVSLGSSALASGNTAPRGAASNFVGDKLWVADANKTVYVYNPGGSLLGSWTAGSLASSAEIEGVATNGADIWIVDAKQDKVFKYTGAASLLSGSQNAAGSFNLASGNTSPKGIVTDGTSIWVVNDSGTDKVYKYTTTGALLGSWTITGAGSTPTGITLDPGGSGNLWTVDSGTDRVYEFAGALNRASGSQAAGSSFVLAAGNSNPQDIADPSGKETAVGATTATALVSKNPSPASPSQPLTFTVTVTGGADGDIVELHDNTNDGDSIATGILQSNSVTLTIPANSLTTGAHELVAVYVGNASKAPSVSDPIVQIIDARPHVAAVTPNDNIPALAGPQHSRVVSLVVAFDQAVQLDPSAITLALHTNNVMLNGVAQQNGFGSLPTNLIVKTTDNIAWTLTFSGNTDDGIDGYSSLKDGVYDVTINAAKVHLAADPTLSMGTNSTTTFHRLYGDTGAPATPAGGTPGADFAAIDNTADNLAFRSAFNKPAGYQAYLDFNGDGIINTADNLHFRTRFNKALTWRI